MKQHLRITAIPNGSTTSKFRLSLLLSPRLDGEGIVTTLSSFPDWLDWPQRIRSSSFEIIVRDTGGKQLSKFPIEPKWPTSLPVSQSLWKMVFPNTAVVQSATATEMKIQHGTTIAAYNTPKIDESVKSVHSQLFAIKAERGAAENFLATSDIIQSIGWIGTDGHLNGFTESHEAVPLSDVSQAFSYFERFHLPTDWVGIGLPYQDTHDFHDTLTSASSYPALMRQLHLTLDFELDRKTFSSIQGEIEISVVASGLFSSKIPSTVLIPWTRIRCELGQAIAQQFRAAPQRDNPPTSDALLDLTKREQFIPLSYDIDGAAMNLKSVALRSRGYATMSNKSASDAPSMVPPLRGVGVRVVNTLQVQEIAAAVARTEQLEKDAINGATPAGSPAPSDIVLFAEDLIKGYRIDVGGASGSMDSLCRREIIFSDLDGQDSSMRQGSVDEGWVVDDALTTAHPSSGAEVKSSQTLFRWDGWSLVVPRPGGAVDDDNKVVKSPLPRIGQSLGVSSRAVDDSVPAYRYGRQYYFRSRLVDMAGNGLSTDEADEVERADRSFRLGPVDCLRHEPVNPPLIARLDGGAGEHGALFAIRDGHSGNRSRVGHLLPAPTSIEIADRHGAFDKLTDERSYDLITHMRDEGQLAPKELEALCESGEIDYAYLRDPAAVGVVIQESWPNQGKARRLSKMSSADRLRIKSYRFLLTAGSRSIDIDDSEIVIKLPPGEAISISVRSDITETDLKLFEMFGMEDEKIASEMALHDMLTPPEDMIFVHATEKPTSAPQFGSLDIGERKLAETHATFIDAGFTVDTETTSRLSFFAEWEEVIDDRTKEVWPVRIRTRAKLFEVTVPLDPGHPLARWKAQDTSASQKGKQSRRDPRSFNFSNDSAAHFDFGDTKYRSISVTSYGTSRFTEFFGDAIDNDIPRFQIASGSASVAVVNTAPPDPPIVAYVMPIFKREQQSRKKADSSVSRGSALRVYLDCMWFGTGDGEQLAVVLADTSFRGGISQIAGDPIFASPGISMSELTVDDFLNAKRIVPEIQRVKSTSGGKGTISLAEGLSSDPVDLVCFDVSLDREKNLLFADIVLKESAAYRPFVRLALARYQDSSVQKTGVSQETLADFIQLSPTRTMTVARKVNDEWTVVVSGIFPVQRDALRTRLILTMERPLYEHPSKTFPWEEYRTQRFLMDQVDTSTWIATIKSVHVERYFRRLRVVLEEYEDWVNRDLDPEAISRRGRLVHTDAVELDN